MAGITFNIPSGLPLPDEPFVNLTASGASSSTASVNLEVDLALTSSGAAANAATVDFALLIQIPGTGENASSGTGSLDRVRDVTGSGASAADGTAALDRNRFLTASGASASDGLADVQIDLQAWGSNSSSGTVVLYEYGTTPAEVSLAKMVDPGTGNRHYLGIRATSSTGFLQLTLLQGSTTIQSWLLDASQTMDPLELLIDTSNADTITDYFDLHVRWQFFETLVPEVDEVYFLLPDGGLAATTTGDASSGSVQLGVVRYLTASGDTASEGSAFTGLLITTSASGPAASDGAAQLDITLDLTASGDSASAATVANGYFVDFAASGPTASTGTSDVTVDLAVDASGAGVAGGTAQLNLDQYHTASGDASADASVSLGLLLDLTASGPSSATGVATPKIDRYVTAAGPASSTASVNNSTIRWVSASGPTAGQPHAIFAYTTTIAEVTLGGIGQVPTDDQHFIFFRQVGNVTGGTLDITLLQGTTVIEAFTGIDARQTMDPLELLVDSANAANITNYSDLRIRWQFFDVFGVIEVDEVWMEIPSEGLIASAPTASDGSANLGVDLSLTSSGAATGSGGTAVLVVRGVTASGENSSDGTVDVTLNIALDASGNAATEGNATLGRNRFVTASGATASTAIASFQTIFIVVGGNASSGTAEVGVGHATGSNASTGSASITRVRYLDSFTGRQTSSGSAALIGTGQLSASSATASHGTCALDSSDFLTASGANASSGTATSSIPITASGATASSGSIIKLDSDDYLVASGATSSAASVYVGGVGNLITATGSNAEAGNIAWPIFLAATGDSASTGSILNADAITVEITASDANASEGTLTLNIIKPILITASGATAAIGNISLSSAIDLGTAASSVYVEVLVPFVASGDAIVEDLYVEILASIFVDDDPVILPDPDPDPDPEPIGNTKQAALQQYGSRSRRRATAVKRRVI